MVKSELVNLGARVPSDLKKAVSEYCDKRGIKLQFFVTEAIEAKLEEILADQYDTVVVAERLKKIENVSEDEMDKYFAKRKKNA